MSAAAAPAGAAAALAPAAPAGPAGPLSARGERGRLVKQQTQAGALYYGGSDQVGARLKAEGLPPLIDLGVAESYPTLGPVMQAEGVVEAAAQAAHAAIAGDAPAFGYPQPENGPLRQALATVMAENVFRSAAAEAAPPTADEIVVTSGATASLEALAFAILDADDALIVPAPLYPAFYIDFHRAGVAIVPTEPGPVTKDTLEAASQRARDAGHAVRGVLFTTPCNPRGCMHSRAETAAVEDYVMAYGLHLIHDAVYAGTAFDESEAVNALPRLPAAHRDRLHTIWGISKDFGLSGWRVGAVHSRNPLVVEAMQPQMRCVEKSCAMWLC